MNGSRAATATASRLARSGRPSQPSGRGCQSRWYGGPLLQVLLLLLLLLLAGCGPTAQNYTSPSAPWYEDTNHVPSAGAGSDTLKIVSFNIRFAEHIGLAIEQLRDPQLAGAGVILLQEMDAAGVDSIAAALGCNSIYYPAAIHGETGRQFGVAVLTTWRILAHQKIVLPHLDPNDLQRIAVWARLGRGPRRLDVYAVHLGTWIDPAERRDQMTRLAASIRGREDGPCIVGGDFNTFTDSHLKVVRRLMRRVGFVEATRTIGWTFTVEVLGLPILHEFLDHIFVRDMQVLSAWRVGQELGASDHSPIEAEVILPPPDRSGLRDPLRGSRRFALP
jgi:endonuclease/exonuclease/phosphatase family metal-dependent hydrolase